MLPYTAKAGNSRNDEKYLSRSQGRSDLDVGEKNAPSLAGAPFRHRVMHSLGRGLSAITSTVRTEFVNWNSIISPDLRHERALSEIGEQLRENSASARNDENAHELDHDALTGLPNRAVFTARLEAALIKTRASGVMLSVLVVRLDNFKVVNDSLGIEAGDVLLRAAARRLQDSLPPNTMAARLGGDQFAILLEGVSEIRARRTAERLATAFQVPFLVAGRRLISTVSIGVAPCRKEELPGEVLRWADIAMHDAKSQAHTRERSHYSVFDVKMLRKGEERLELEAALDHAMRHDTDQFHLVYQPIYNIETGRLYGIEALMRWRHPSKGAISPNIFIPLAEETGMIHELTDWVLRGACRCFAQLQESLPVSLQPDFVSVNFSSVVLQSERTAPNILNCLRANGMSPSHLAVEVTESVIARESASVLQVLSRLRAAGIKVLLDDFGVGYSSLASLMDLPIDAIKIDRQFVGFLEKRPAARAIVQAIVDLANALQMEIICEGIERHGQREIVAQMGQLHGQGFLFSRPLPLKDLETLLSAVKQSEPRTGDSACGESLTAARSRPEPCKFIIE